MRHLKDMRYLLLIATVPFMTSCQVMTASTSVISNSIACGTTESEQLFPQLGSKRFINIDFSIKETNKTIPFKHVAECEYQGSICGGGAWFDIWYGNRSKKEVSIFTRIARFIHLFEKIRSKSDFIFLMSAFVGDTTSPLFWLNPELFTNGNGNAKLFPVPVGAVMMLICGKLS